MWRSRLEPISPATWEKVSGRTHRKARRGYGRIKRAKRSPFAMRLRRRLFH